MDETLKADIFPFTKDFTFCSKNHFFLLELQNLRSIRKFKTHVVKLPHFTGKEHRPRNVNDLSKVKK